MSATASQQLWAQGHVKTQGGAQDCVDMCALTFRVEMANQLQRQDEGEGCKRTCGFLFSFPPIFVLIFLSDYIHSTVVYSLSLQVSDSSSFSQRWINAPCFLIHLPLLSVFPSPNYSKDHTNSSASSVTPSGFCWKQRLRDLERTSRSFNLEKNGDYSSSLSTLLSPSICPCTAPQQPTSPFLFYFTAYFAWKCSRAVPSLSAVYMDSG